METLSGVLVVFNCISDLGILVAIFVALGVSIFLSFGIASLSLICADIGKNKKEKLTSIAIALICIIMLWLGQW